MTPPSPALHAAVDHLRSVVARIDPTTYLSPAYPSEWSIADTLSHIGSSAVILSRRIDDVVAERTSDETFPQTVWDEWNAKAPAAQVHEAPVAEGALLERLESLPHDQRASFTFAMGPMTFDFDGFVGLRLIELALHTWDVEVMLDATATIPQRAVGVVIDNLAMMVRFTGKPSGDVSDLRIRTVDPTRHFLLSFDADSVALSSSEPFGDVDLELPGESLVRLVYGRLDPSHTPAAVDDRHLGALRRAFPGI